MGPTSKDSSSFASGWQVLHNADAAGRGCLHFSLALTQVELYFWGYTVKPPFPQTSWLWIQFSSWPGCSQNRRLYCRTKPLFSTRHPFMLIPVWSVTSHLSGDKRDLVFEQIASQTVFQKELSLRTEVPLVTSPLQSVKNEQRQCRWHTQTSRDTSWSGPSPL